MHLFSFWASCWMGHVSCQAFPSGCVDVTWAGHKEGIFIVLKALVCWTLCISLSEGSPSLSFFPLCLGVIDCTPFIHKPAVPLDCPTHP